MRKLASVQIIDEILPIKKADSLECAVVGGWKVVVRKGEYQTGDEVIYCEVDSFIPHEVAPFLTKPGQEPKEYQGIKGQQLKTVKLRGQLSQGLILPLPEDMQCYMVGDDCTEALGIVKWERPLDTSLQGSARGNFPSFIHKTDQERCQNLKHDINSHAIKGTKFEVTEKLDGCFLSKQYIETWDGKTVTIGDIVNKGIRPELIGVNSLGEIVPTQIVNTFKNGTKSKWLDIFYEPYSNSRVIGQSGKLRTTPNHKIFLENMQEISASDLKNNDSILMQSDEWCENTIHYIKSALLGDGSLGGYGHYSFNECHATTVEEYCQYILSLMPDNLCSTRVQTSGYGSEVRHMKLFSSFKLKQLREEWYPDNKKAVPKNLDWVDDFTIAKWYMDDGSLAHNEKQNDRACFASNAFTKEDVERLAKKLESMYGVSTCLVDSKGYSIRVNYSKGTIDNLWASIAPYIHGCFLYKLPEKFRNRVFVPLESFKKEKTLVSVKVKDIKNVEVNKSNFPSGATGYDIETSTNNYFCGGILVHNSSMTAYVYDGVFGVCSRNIDLSEDETNAYWKVARGFDLESKLKSLGGEYSFAIQGELIGPKIQGNPYKIDRHLFYVFDIFDITNQTYLTASERWRIVGELGLCHVPIIFGETEVVASVDELLKLSEGKSTLNNKIEREGYVYKSIEDPNFSFKVISNKFLLK